MAPRRSFLAVLAAVAIAAPPCWSQAAEANGAPARFTLRVRPALEIPLGTSAQVFTLGGNAAVDLVYRFGTSPISIGGGIDYSYTPLLSPDSLSVASAHVGVSVTVALAPWLSLEAFASGGAFLGALNDFTATSWNPTASAGASLEAALSSSWRIGAGAAYVARFGLYDGIRVFLGSSFVLPPAAQKTPPRSSAQPLAGEVTIDDVALAPALPVFYKYYDDHPVGSVRISNHGAGPASEIVVSVYVKQYMDNPKPLSIDGVLAAGETRSVDVYALFTPAVLTITEGTKASAEITVDYTAQGVTFEARKVETLEFLNRNAMTWDDNRRAAAFVTAKDPAVLTFAKGVAGSLRSSLAPSINARLQTALGLHEALDLYGLSYVTDPTTPFVQFSQSTSSVDFLQFPRQTLQYRAGDCDDISILYGAMLEAVGVPAAFVTTPGHIFIAVATGLSESQAAGALLPPDQLIIHDEKAWVPVEITLRRQGFLAAWSLGAREWREAQAAGQAGFYPIEEAWNAFAPVGLPGTTDEPALPPNDRVVASATAEIGRFVDQVTLPLVTSLQAQIRTGGGPAAMNKLGVLYAQYGQPVKAEQQFRQALAVQKDFLPAVLNLGNLLFMKQDWEGAAVQYQQASTLAPDNARVALALARVSRERNDAEAVRRNFEIVKRLDPALAETYAYLDQGAAGPTRAADAEEERAAVLWEVP